MGDLFVDNFKPRLLWGCFLSEWYRIIYAIECDNLHLLIAIRTLVNALISERPEFMEAWWVHSAQK